MKKKNICFLGSVLILSFNLSAASYKISKVNYQIEGSTQESVLRKNVPVNENRLFEEKSDLEKYIQELKQDLINTRCFEYSEITAEFSDPDESDIISTELTVSVKDSFHFLALPYLKYSSVNGLSIKFKAKDTNFFGSMNELNTSLDLQLEPDEEGNPFRIFEPEINISLDYPFSKNDFVFTWVNDYSVSYTWGETSPEWDIQTGLRVDIPLQNTTLSTAFYQGFIRNFDYRDSFDDTFIKERLEIYSPLTITDIPNYGQLKLIPKLHLVYNWDPFQRNGKSGIKDSSLKGPELTYSAGLTFGKINWDGNFRNGLEAVCTPKAAYNFATHLDDSVKPWSLGISGELRYFKSFGFAALYSHAYTFSYMASEKTYGEEQVDGFIRGVIDSKKSLHNRESYQAKVPAAFVLNLDFPVRIIKTDWESFPVTKNLSFMRHFNFEMQLNPFFDMAFIKTTENTHGNSSVFRLSDGFYGTGLEVLVFPSKWSSYVIRASIGFDAGRKIFNFENKWRNNECRPYEISIGMGTHY